MFRPLILPTVQIALLSAAAMAQQPIGTVGVQDATVAGALEVTNGRAVLVGNTAITAKDHTAEIALNRGGTIRVCSTSGLHVIAGKSAFDAQPLMLALDRGAVEVQMAATTSDVLLTPDLRFAIAGNAPLDLRMRVARNGDTCVENRGAAAPLIHIADQFGDASYDLRPGQHVLFEHGSLKDVVDSETSPCGCPPEPSVSIADAVLSPSGATSPAKQAEAQHPFPAAVSQGLAPTPGPTPSQPGEVHQQVAATLSFGANATRDSTATPTPAATTTPSTSTASTSTPTAMPSSTPSQAPPRITAQSETPTPTTPPSSNDLVHRIGHFFKRLFGRG